jgi:pantoate--beta-alanine ligase
MHILDSLEALRAYRQTHPSSLGLIPTMGYLHAGHIALVRAARQAHAQVMASIFVNPTQFAANEDLSSYPRDLARDFALLEAEGVDAVFTPTPAQMYPEDYQTYITVEQVSQGREGAARPNHFRGVATVVAKLFNLTQPNAAYFGQKDAQQVAVVRRMVRDLDFPLSIKVHPIIREADGLAMSSRNVYLNPTERHAASVLYRALSAATQCYEQGERQPDALRAEAHAILAAEPLAKPAYVSLALASNLEEVSAPSSAPLLLSIAAQVGKPRLLDNCLLPAALNTLEGASASLGI